MNDNETDAEKITIADVGLDFQEETLLVISRQCWETASDIAEVFLVNDCEIISHFAVIGRFGKD